MRHSIEPTEVVYLWFYLKLSKNWSWTNKPYGPHLLHFMTTENNKYHGPAASHLTLYIEPVNGKWHWVQVMFKPNSLDRTNDRPNHDGELRGWVDGKPVIERTDVVFRSTDFPKLKFIQFMMLPYFHDGVRHDQTLWIDELAVGAKRIGANLRPGRRPGEQ